MLTKGKRERIITKTVQISSRLQIADNVKTLTMLNSALNCLAIASSMESDTQAERCIRLASRLANLSKKE